MGGEAGFRALIKDGQALGFKMMPMFGANTANREQPMFARDRRRRHVKDRRRSLRSQLGGLGQRPPP